MESIQEAGAEAARGGRVTVLEANAFSSFNAASASGSTDINARIAHATRSGFCYVSPDGAIVRNERFGTCRVVSEDPFTVEYKVNPGVVWSDGTPVDAADLLLAWAAGSGYYDDDTADGAGTRYFRPAAGTSRLAATGFPQIGDDFRSITLTFGKRPPEWELALGVDQPAHVVAVKAGLTGKNALTSLLRQTPRGNRRSPQPSSLRLLAAAQFWNSGFDSAGLPADPLISVSTGPYRVQAIEPGVSLTLTRNPRYTSGPDPALDEIVVRFVPSTASQVAGLMEGSADLISPQSGMEGLGALEALDDSAHTIQRFNQPGFDHLDLNFFGPFKERAVREAFLRTVPRADITRAVIGALDPGAALLDSFVFLPGHPAYDRVVKENGSSDYQDHDLDRARRMLGDSAPRIRILYNSDNPNRVTAFRLIRSSAERAGFIVLDGGRSGSAWSLSLGAKDYDAAIFGWAVPEPAASIAGQIFATGAPSNFNGFSDTESDSLIADMNVAAEREKRDQLLARLDRRLWESAYGLPLYRAVGVVAHSSELLGVRPGINVLGAWASLYEWAWSTAREGSGNA